MESLTILWQSTGLANFELGQIVMMLVGCGLLYLAIAKSFEQLLLLPIGFGAILTNIPLAGFTEVGGLLHYIYYAGIDTGIFPLLIFMGVGAMTDFGALIANPKMLLLGAAAQFGIFATLFGAIALNGVPGIEFTLKDASAIAIIGGADGPTAIFLASKLAPDLLGAIAVAAYSYMALVPIIQPPIMRALTTKEERQIKMEQLQQLMDELLDEETSEIIKKRFSELNETQSHNAKNKITNKRKMDWLRKLNSLEQSPQLNTKIFVSFDFNDDAYFNKFSQVACQNELDITTGKSPGEKPTMREAIIDRINQCDCFMGIWTKRTNGEFSPWLLWELGVAQALHKPFKLLMAPDIDPDTWQRINPEANQYTFHPLDFEQIANDAIASLLENMARHKKF